MVAPIWISSQSAGRLSPAFSFSQRSFRKAPYSGTGNAPVVGGFNLEDTHAITADGHESFTENPDNIFWK